MANAKKCDRCGTYYEQYSRTFLVYNGIPYRGVELDFCPTCYKKIEAFITNNSDDPTEPEEIMND